MIRNIRIFWLILLSTIGINAMGQSLRSDDKTLHWETGLDLGAGWRTGFVGTLRLSYFPIQYVGVRSSIGMAGDIIFQWSSSTDKAIRFVFNPALVLRSPRLYPKDQGNDGLYLFAEPGITLSPALSGRSGARTTCWDIKAGLNLKVDEMIILTLGYDVTNLNLYSGTSKYDPTDIWKDRVSHGIYVGIGVQFGSSSKKHTPRYIDPNL